MWFLALLLTPHPDNRLSAAMAAPRYRSHAECMADGMQRMTGLASVGYHGRFMCMYRGEPDRELARTAQAEF